MRQQAFRQPTRQDEVDVFVTGDSQAQFVGEVLTDMLPSDLFDVSVVARNATGLTNPEFFNWEINARQEIAARKPDAVVMVMGGNDGFNVLHDGTLYGPDDPEWQTEYARRAAVVMRELGSNGKRPVYWVPPPTARDTKYNGIYATQNRAVEQAAPAVPGARYVDIYNTINHGRYSDELKIDGQRVLARQSDGVHFSREGAVVPARLIFRAMARDYKVLRGDDECVALARCCSGWRCWPRRPARRRSATGCSSNGDSLAVGTRPYIPAELRGWRVTQSAAVSRHAFEAAGVLRAYGRSLPRVIHVSLGTNDDPRQVSAFRAAIRDVMAVAGPRRCVVWTNIVRPPVAGAELRRLQPRTGAGVAPARESARGRLGSPRTPEPAVAGRRRRPRERGRVSRPGARDRALGAALPMTARLYVTSLSNPSKAASAMLAHKRLSHRRIDLLAGLPPLPRARAGFEGRTVPALELDDGRHVQGSLEISRALDELIPERPLFPDEPVARSAVERAERWGHDELQPVPRRIFRWAAMEDPAVRRWIAAQVEGVPAPAIVATLSRPISTLRCAESGGDRGDDPRQRPPAHRAARSGRRAGRGGHARRPGAQRGRLPGPIEREDAARLQGIAVRRAPAQLARGARAVPAVRGRDALVRDSRDLVLGGVGRHRGEQPVGAAAAFERARPHVVRRGTGRPASAGATTHASSSSSPSSCPAPQPA